LKSEAGKSLEDYTEKIFEAPYSAGATLARKNSSTVAERGFFFPPLEGNKCLQPN
jgi:hypothetical protein